MAGRYHIRIHKSRSQCSWPYRHFVAQKDALVQLRTSQFKHYQVRVKLRWARNFQAFSEAQHQTCFEPLKGALRTPQCLHRWSVWTDTTLDLSAVHATWNSLSVNLLVLRCLIPVQWHDFFLNIVSSVHNYCGLSCLAWWCSLYILLHVQLKVCTAFCVLWQHTLMLVDVSPTWNKNNDSPTWNKATRRI